MMKEYFLRDLLKIKNGKDHKTVSNGAIPIFGSGGIMRYGNQFLYDKPSILLPRKGTLDNIQFSKIPFWTVDTIYYTEINEDITEPYFLYNYLKILNLENLNTGTGVPSMTFDSYYNLKIQLPNLPIQKKIANILMDIDNKIELDNKLNDNLEQMAKTLYDYWFLQFDFPDENGRPYKSSGGKMVWNEVLKREIPISWEVRKISQIAKTGSGGTPKSTEKDYYENGDVPWINSGELNNSFIISTNNYITELGMKNSNAKLFPRDTILMAMYGATAGKTSILSFEATTNQAICAVMPLETEMFHYTKFVLDDMYKYLINLSTGSARDNLSQDKIRELNIIVPNNFVLNQHSKMTFKYFEKIRNNLQQNQQLNSLRDWLLPMLMNGQVKVE